MELHQGSFTLKFYTIQKVLVQFDFPNVSVQQYENKWKDLRTQGHDHPKSPLFHVCAFKSDGTLTVTDIWESADAFQAFGSRLMPLLEKHDIPRVQPKIIPVHYVYEHNLETANRLKINSPCQCRQRLF